MRYALLVAAIVLGACNGGTARSEGSPTLTGVVTDVTSTGLDEVSSFELRSEGETYTIQIDEERDYGFPVGHLNAHRTSGEPVIVETTRRDGELVALSIEDA